jgi:hypothetical protein
MAAFQRGIYAYRRNFGKVSNCDFFNCNVCNIRTRVSCVLYRLHVGMKLPSVIMVEDLGDMTKDTMRH